MSENNNKPSRFSESNSGKGNQSGKIPGLGTTTINKGMYGNGNKPSINGQKQNRSSK